MIQVEKAEAGTTLAAVSKSIGSTLPGMVHAAAQKLALAADAAEVLDARDAARLTYTTAQVAGRIAKAKGAHDTLVAAAHRAQADALDIEAAAKRRLADEYDAAQPDDAAVSGRPKKSVPDENAFSAKAVGLTRKQVHEARQVRDAELASPGIIRQTLDDKLAAGEEPTRAAVNAAVAKVFGKTQPIDPRTDEDREFDNLQAAWDEAREIVRGRFLQENSLGMASEGMDHSIEHVSPIGGSVGANAGEGHVDRSALRASSAVKVGATNSPAGADETERPVGAGVTAGETATSLVSHSAGEGAPRPGAERGAEPRQTPVLHSAPFTPKVTEQIGAARTPSPAAPVTPKEPKLNPDCQKAARGEACFLSHSAASCSKCASAATKARKAA